jgi:phytoene dehydrogenase-like protein
VKTLPLLPRTIAEVKRGLGATGVPQADALIDGLLIDATGATAAECSAIQGAIALDIYRRGCQCVPGGTARLAMDLVRSIRNSGSDVRFREPIVSIRRRREGWLLRTACGGATLARSVVANVPPAALERLLGAATDTVVAPPREDAWGAFLLHLGIDATGLDPVHPFQQVVRDGEEGSAEGDNCLVSIFPGRGEREHRWSISVSTHTRAEGWWINSPELSFRRPALEERLLESVERVIPDVRQRIVVQRSATPRTFQRFTGRPGGYVGGLIQRPSNAAFFAASRRPARGLFLAGDHVFPGQGTVGVALSGINAHRDVAEYLQRSPML